MRNSAKNIGFLFDLDGVLIDSENEYTRIWAQINREYPTGIENFETKIKGCTLTKILTENYSEEVRPLVSKRLHELEALMRYNFLPNAREFLELAQEMLIPCALVTSSDEVKMNHLYEELPDLSNFFDIIITGSQVKTSKPSPEGYLLAAASIGRNPRNCAVFEDSLQGVMAGKNAGAYVVGVAGTLPEDLLSPFSDIIINRFAELDSDLLIQKLNDR